MLCFWNLPSSENEKVNPVNFHLMNNQENRICSLWLIVSIFSLTWDCLMHLFLRTLPEVLQSWKSLLVLGWTRLKNDTVAMVTNETLLTKFKSNYRNTCTQHRQWNDSSLSAAVCFMVRGHSRKYNLIQQPVHTLLWGATAESTTWFNSLSTPYCEGPQQKVQPDSTACPHLTVRGHSRKYNLIQQPVHTLLWGATAESTTWFNSLSTPYCEGPQQKVQPDSTACPHLTVRGHSRKYNLIQQPVHTLLSYSNIAPLQHDKHYYCADTYSDKER